MRYDTLYPYDLPPGEDSRLILAILRIHRDRLAVRQGPMQWGDLAEMIQEELCSNEKLMRALLYHSMQEFFFAR